MGTLELSIGAGVDSRIDQAMECWRLESREQNTLFQKQMMEQMQMIVRIFTQQQPLRLSPEFPLRDRTEPIFLGVGVEPQPGGASEFEFDTDTVGENVRERRPGATANRHHPNYPTLKLKIPLFEGENLRWWSRRCERVFSL